MNPIRWIFPAGSASTVIGASTMMRARTTASPISRMGTSMGTAGGGLADVGRVESSRKRDAFKVRRNRGSPGHMEHIRHQGRGTTALAARQAAEAGRSRSLAAR